MGQGSLLTQQSSRAAVPPLLDPACVLPALRTVLIPEALHCWWAVIVLPVTVAAAAVLALSALGLLSSAVTLVPESLQQLVAVFTSSWPAASGIAGEAAAAAVAEPAVIAGLGAAAVSSVPQILVAVLAVHVALSRRATSLAKQQEGREVKPAAAGVTLKSSSGPSGAELAASAAQGARLAALLVVRVMVLCTGVGHVLSNMV
jgi:hypothetical protein